MTATAEDDQLTGLERGSGPLVDARTAIATGIVLERRLGAGGMSTVFRGRVSAGPRSSELAPGTPELVAVKIVLPSTVTTLARLGLEARDFVKKEVVALSKVMERSPRTPHVVGIYGNGELDVSVLGRTIRLPWMAIELIEAADGGPSLEDRVLASSGIDPARAMRLIRGLCDGVIALHEEGIVHRDIKPENVLVAGAPPLEVPKLSDCGIARIAGMNLATLAAASAEYAALEQLCSVHEEANPAIGPWTDVHALSAVIWFILAGCSWWEASEGAGGAGAWDRGYRAPLASGTAVHERLRADPALGEAISAVLARGGSARLGGAGLRAGAGSKAFAIYERRLARLIGEPRYESVGELTRALFPLLEQLVAPPSTARPAAARGSVASETTTTKPFLKPGNAISLALVQPDGRILARVGRRLFYLADARPNLVHVQPEHEAALLAATSLLALPGGGFGLVGPAGVLSFQGGVASLHPLPAGAGALDAASSDPQAIVIVTAERDGGHGPELWTATTPTSWAGPVALDALNGVPSAVVKGHGGVMFVGTSRRGTQWRALFVSDDGRVKVWAPALGERGSLSCVVAGPSREFFAAGTDQIVRFAPREDGATSERAEAEGTPVAMSVDPTGSPWLLLPHAVLRRHLEDGRASWRAHAVTHADTGAAPFVAFSVTKSGVRVIDGASSVLDITPDDAPRWTLDGTTGF